MNAAAIVSTLASDTLAGRLRELAGDERNVQADFLAHLDEFDRRRAYLEAGYGSLWDFCLRALHLREGAAGRRIGAMRVLRRFPELDAALRDGRLCLSTVSLLGQVLTEENLDALVAQAAYRTKADVDHLVASIRERPAPKDGIRKLPQRCDEALGAPEEAARLAPVTRSPAPELTLVARHEAADETSMKSSSDASDCSTFAAAANGSDDHPAPAQIAARPNATPDRPPSAEMRPVSRNRWSLRVTIDAACKEDLERLTSLLGHKCGADLAEVLREAIRCGTEKHGKRRGAVFSSRRRAKESVRPATPGDRYVPAEVRREVWERDGGCCTWRSDDGTRCGSRRKIEIDHIRPPLLGGTSDPGNLRLLCRPHNLLHAERVWGREHMARFRRRSVTLSGDSEAPPA